MTEQEALAMMRGAGAYEEGHFLMRSGRHADAYLSCGRLIERSDAAEALCEALAERARPLGADVVIAPALGGLIFGYLVARTLGKRFIFCERKDGVMTLRRGFSIARGARVLIVEDRVTTGGSVREVMEIVRALGAETVGVAALLDCTGGRAALGVPFEALVRTEVRLYPAADCPLCRAGVPMSPARGDARES